LGKQKHTLFGEHRNNSLRVSEQVVTCLVIWVFTHARTVNQIALAACDDIADSSGVTSESLRIDNSLNIHGHGEQVTFVRKHRVIWVCLCSRQISGHGDIHRNAVLPHERVGGRLAEACCCIGDCEPRTLILTKINAAVGQDACHPSIPAPTVFDGLSAWCAEKTPPLWSTASATEQWAAHVVFHAKPAPHMASFGVVSSL